MPVSSSVHISGCLDHIIRLAPRSILDIGCGFGLWGFLCREYLDVWNERVQPEEWQVRIDGVELFGPYIQAHQRALYNNIIIKDVREALAELGEYELVIAGDVIEHMDKPEGEWVIEQLYDKATRAMLINIPLGGNWDHEERHGNPGELHRSQWSTDDFTPYPYIFKQYELPCGQYGSFFCPKDVSPTARATGLHAIAQRREDAGDIEGALRAIAKAHAMQPDSAPVALHLTELLLRCGEHAAAIQTLHRTLEVNPGFHYARLTLARVYAATGDKPAAAREAQALFAHPTVDEELRSLAQGLLL